MTNNPVLSVCIPTYNRAVYLKEAIESVLAQVNNHHQGLVEIIISDNASTDATAKIVSLAQEKSIVPIKYFVNEQNMGFDRNILKVVSLAAGQYVLILGDDDRLLPGVIDCMLNEINASPDVDLFLAEREEYDHFLQHRFPYRPALKINGPTVFDFNRGAVQDYLKSVSRLPALFSYLSTIVFKREKWEAVKGREKFVGSEYIHVFMFMSLVWGEKKGKLKYLPLRIVMTRWASSGAFEHGKLIQRVKKDALAFREISNNVLKDRKLVAQIETLLIKNDLFSWTVRAKYTGGPAFYYDLFPFLFRYYWRIPLFWLKIFPLLFVPSFILRIMRWSYRKHVKGEPVVLKEILDD